MFLISKIINKLNRTQVFHVSNTMNKKFNIAYSSKLYTTDNCDDKKKEKDKKGSECPTPGPVRSGERIISKMPMSEECIKQKKCGMERVKPVCEFGHAVYSTKNMGKKISKECRAKVEAKTKEMLSKITIGEDGEIINKEKCELKEKDTKKKREGFQRTPPCTVNKKRGKDQFIPVYCENIIGDCLNKEVLQRIAQSSKIKCLNQYVNRPLTEEEAQIEESNQSNSSEPCGELSCQKYDNTKQENIKIIKDATPQKTMHFYPEGDWNYTDPD